MIEEKDVPRCPRCVTTMTHRHDWDGTIDDDVWETAQMEWERAAYKLSTDWLVCGHCGFQMPDNDPKCKAGAYLIVNPREGR